MWLCLLVTTLQASEPEFEVRNPGRSLEKAPVALVVTTPGIAAEAYGGWVEALENKGFDARLLVFSSAVTQLSTAAAGVRGAAKELGDRNWVLAAHGYGGVLALMAGVTPGRMALVGTPLQAQVTRLEVPAANGQQGLPWPEDWIGSLPSTMLSRKMGRAYLSLVEEMPAYAAPACPTWLAASGSDPIAPPEIVRLASVDWPDRTWYRAGILSMAGAELQHAGLLLDPEIAQLMAEFLSEGE